MASSVRPDPTIPRTAAPPAASTKGPPPKPAAGKPAPPAASSGTNQSSKGQPSKGKNGEAGDEEQPVEEILIGTSMVGQLFPPFSISLLVHIIALLILALIVSEPPKVEPPRLITSTSTEEMEEVGEDVPEEVQTEDPQTETTEVTSEVVVTETEVVDVQVETPAQAVETADVAVEFTDFASESASSSDLTKQMGTPTGVPGGIGARGSESARKAAVQRGGGNDQSESAVDGALKWLALHQMADGGWSLEMKDCCGGQCTHSGNRREDRGAATALAILPFLGRGYTHETGPYKKQVLAGLNFLAELIVAGNGKLPDGDLYSQGVAGIALSESYAMTQDNRLQAPAQMALNYIMASQDPVGGGWRYTPQQPGDTSAVGWQLMALKSGHMAYLEVNPMVIKRAVDFLNSVQVDEGSAYGYEGPGDGPGTSAVGLLCRMYLGWKKDHPGLDRGVTRLTKMGPSKDLYFDYYATQVIHHVEGERWASWNPRMRDMLINTQVKTGHMAGSWYDGVDGGGHSVHAGGRLYCTALACMILEVYYRHLPIYGTQSVEEEFKE